MHVVKEIRPFILCCIVENVNLNNGNLRKFLQLQTKLHDAICGKREKSTIATHDFNRLPVNLPDSPDLSNSFDTLPKLPNNQIDCKTLQQKIQDEIDAVVGAGRPPTLDDRIK